MSTNFDNLTNEDYSKSSKLSITDVLSNIDNANYKYYDSLPEHEKKQFTPYTVLRWMSSLDDALLLTYKSSSVEAIFGKWTAGGKEALNELKDEFNLNGGNIIGISKYEHAKYDWRIKFSIKDMNTANQLIDKLQSEFSITNPKLETLTDTSFYKQYLIYLNELVNDGFWELQSSPEIVYELMCSVSSIFGGNIDAKRTWLPFSKSIKSVDSDILNVFKRSVSKISASQLNDTEYKILLHSYDNKTFEEMLKDMGYQDTDRKKLLEKFKKEQKKYVKED